MASSCTEILPKGFPNRVSSRVRRCRTKSSMSRARTRPTRDDTREKLLEAAARVFEEQGIGGTSIETIAAAAGFTRGAFYSNFKSKGSPRANHSTQSRSARQAQKPRGLY